jgi:hypothetical protein
MKNPLSYCMLRNFPSSLAILLWMARNTKAASTTAVEKLLKFSQMWIEGSYIHEHPDNPSLLNGSGILIELLAQQCLNMPAFNEVKHLLEAEEGKLAKYWQVHALVSEENLDSITRKSIARQMQEVMEDPTYIPAMNVLPLTDFFGLWFQSRNQSNLLTMEWHAVLAIAIHSIISDLALRNPKRSALVLHSVADILFDRLRMVGNNRLPSSVTCKLVLAA